MSRKAIAGMAVAAIAAGFTIQPVMAQDRYRSDQYQSTDRYQGRPQARSFEDGYRAGYRAGYNTARHRGPYNDRPPQISSDDGGRGNLNQRWQQRYARTYTYNDDTYYRECRNSPDPAGVIGGALIGGLLGNAVGRGGGRAGATVAGVVIGGALGASLTKRMDCEDRSYAYRTYYDGFNSGRPHSNWQWENPNSGNYGDFRIGDYYTDPDGFRCATFTQQVYIDDRPRLANGHACQQPDGNWTIVD